MGDDDATTPRMSGYLEKKGKMRMMSTWKRYWFVLEGRLLLYYRSKDEYDAISPCKGSINLGPPCSVKSYPSMACVFQLETRNNTITLRAENSDEQKNWMQSIMTALNQNQSIKLDTKKQLNYFRYSLSYLIPKTEPNQTSSGPFLERQNTLPPNKDNDEIIERLRKIGAQSYGGSLNAITKFTKSPSQCSLKCNNDNKRKSNSSNNITKNEQNIYESVPTSTNRLDSLMIDNDNYSLPLKKRYSLNNSNSNLIIDNTQYCGIIDNDVDDDDEDKKSERSECVYEEVPVDCNKNNVIIENNLYCKGAIDTENEYEDLDKYRNNDNNDKKSTKKTKKKCSKKLGIFHNNNNINSDNNNNNSKEKGLKKSQSFLQKVWKKRNRKQNRSTNNDNNDNDDDLYVEVDDKTIVEKTDIADSSTVQILSELQHILEIKKPLLEKSLSLEASCDKKCDKVRLVLPTLPPKEKKIKNISDTVRNIDEILKDLNCEHKESKTKVKLLIDKFNSDNIGGRIDEINDYDDTVELRQQSRNSLKPQRYSNDLNQLLDELAKVTVAPIMTPGVTISLINPNISDDELLKLLPIRKRRLSEPDYDIPRSHRSIQSLSKRDDDYGGGGGGGGDDDGLTATRFFGPVLNNSNKDECVYSSMTPDSLEIEDIISDRKTQFDGSYTSHTYNQCDDNKNNKQTIYSTPKTLISLVNTSRDNQQNKENMIVFQHIDDEVFDDSLENCNETFTKF